MSNPNPVTLVTVKDTPPPGGAQEIIGRYYPSVVGEPIFKTVVPKYAPNFTSDEEPEGDVETKVVAPARKRVGRPKSAEVAETKTRKRAPRPAAKVVDEG